MFKGRHDFNRELAAVSLAAIPSYLEVPEEKRIVHFVVSLLATVVAAALLGMMLGIGGYATIEHLKPTIDAGGGYNMLGGLGRQAELMEQGGNDRYELPADGKITTAQMTKYLSIMHKVADLRADQQKNLQQFQQQNKEKKDFSLADIGTLTSGMNAVMGSANAEMEVVKTGCGNWAEHSWVKNQLRTAMIQKDINDAVRHNYALYQKHEDELRVLMQ